MSAKSQISEKISQEVVDLSTAFEQFHVKFGHPDSRPSFLDAFSLIQSQDCLEGLEFILGRIGIHNRTTAGGPHKEMLALAYIFDFYADDVYIGIGPIAQPGREPVSPEKLFENVKQASESLLQVIDIWVDVLKDGGDSNEHSLKQTSVKVFQRYQDVVSEWIVVTLGSLEQIQNHESQTHLKKLGLTLDQLSTTVVQDLTDDLYDIIRDFYSHKLVYNGMKTVVTGIEAVTSTYMTHESMQFLADTVYWELLEKEIDRADPSLATRGYQRVLMHLEKFRDMLEETVSTSQNRTFVKTFHETLNSVYVEPLNQLLETGFDNAQLSLIDTDKLYETVKSILVYMSNFLSQYKPPNVRESYQMTIINIFSGESLTRGQKLRCVFLLMDGEMDQFYHVVQQFSSFDAFVENCRRNGII